ncbi:LptF/LptG family permease [Candidatus Pelagibacter sp.]|nr:LptF/LptG family permease [Candidatus Pelagibacter sp.]
MKKLIFRKLLKDVLKSFIIITFSLSLIVWVIQAVNFLDFVTNDGHSLSVYFSYTFFNFPKIIHRILPFTFFISLFFTISQYEQNNELIIYWNNGIKKVQFMNIVIFYSILVFLFQIFLGSYISPMAQDKSRSFLRTSSVDFFPSLIKPGKFIDTVTDLTIFIKSKNSSGLFKDVFLHDSEKGNESSQTIQGKSGFLINKDGNRYFELYDGRITNIENKKISTITFDKIKFDLSKYASQTITFPKIQEAPSHDLFNCLYYTYTEKINMFKAEFLRCEKSTFENVKEEFIKRFLKPFYLITIGLMCSLMIITSKENKDYNYFRFFLFVAIFLIIVISEVSLRYSTNNEYLMLGIISLPLIFFLVMYIPLITKFINRI